MKCWLGFILPFFLAACTAPAARPTQTSTQTPTQAAFERTKLFALTAEMETQTSGYPDNPATITAIMANKSVQGTSAAASLTAQPSETPLPTVPAQAPFCHAADLQRSFSSNGATQAILLSAGLTNIRSGPCFLQSWPEVRLLDQKGLALDVDYGYFDLGFGVPGYTATQRAQEYTTAKVGLWPGWSVWLNLIWQNWCAAPVSAGAVVRLTFTQGSEVITIPTDVQAGGACNAPGQRSYVGVAKLVLIPAP